MKKRTRARFIIIIAMFIILLPIFNIWCGKVYGTTTVGSQDEWLQAISDISDEILSDGDWIYSNSGTSSSYKKAKKNNHKMNCAKFVSYALQYFGVFDSGMSFYGDSSGLHYSGGAEDRLKEIAEITKYKSGQKKISDVKDELQPGDIVTFYVAHTCVYLDKNKYATGGKSSTNTRKNRRKIYNIN